MADVEPQANPVATNLEEIDAYGHRALMKRIAKERAAAEKRGDAKQEKLLRSFLQDLDKHKADFEASPVFAQKIREGFKQVLQTGVLDVEKGTVSVSNVPPQSESGAEEPSPAAAKPLTASERAAQAKAKRGEQLAKVQAALRARRAGAATQIPRVDVPPPVEVPPTAAAVEVPVEAPVAEVAAPAAPAAAKARVRGKLGMLRSKPVMAGVAALAGLGLIRKLNEKPEDNRSAIQEFQTRVAVERSKEVARLLENARLERAIRENQMRLARGNPDLYTSVMAGRRVPKGSVVLGGVPRQDLMRELAASMDSGRYAQPDPLSELLG